MPGDFFNSGPFMPHGGCYLWTQTLIALHVISDALIVLAYYSIPIMLLYFARKRKDLKFHWIFMSFAVFILACGTTHLMEIWNIWHANYWLSGWIKAITALFSVPTAFLLVKLIPQALALPRPDALQKAYGELEQRVTERTLQLKNSNETLMQEVRERQRAEQESHESEVRLRAVLDSSLNAVVVISSGGKITEWNARAETIFGWTRKEAIGRELAEMIIPPPHQGVHRHGMEPFLATDEGPALNRLIEMSAMRRNGDEFPIELFIRALKSGDTVTFCGFITDVTERKRTEDELKASFKEVGDLKSALDEHAIVAITDPKGRITYVTTSFARSQSMRGRNCSARITASSIRPFTQRISFASSGAPLPAAKFGKVKSKQGQGRLVLLGGNDHCAVPRRGRQTVSIRGHPRPHSITSHQPTGGNSAR